MVDFVECGLDLRPSSGTSTWMSSKPADMGWSMRVGDRSLLDILCCQNRSQATLPINICFTNALHIRAFRSRSMPEALFDLRISTSARTNRLEQMIPSHARPAKAATRSITPETNPWVGCSCAHICLCKAAFWLYCPKVDAQPRCQVHVVRR